MGVENIFNNYLLILIGLLISRSILTSCILQLQKGWIKFGVELDYVLVHLNEKSERESWGGAM